MCVIYLLNFRLVFLNVPEDSHDTRPIMWFFQAVFETCFTLYVMPIVMCLSDYLYWCTKEYHNC